MSYENYFDLALENFAGEPIEAIVVNPKQYDLPTLHGIQPGKVLTWDEAKPSLHFDWNTGYGLPGCYAICAWTKTWVIFVSQYDGSTSLEKVPQNPVDHLPIMPGG